MPTTLSKLMTLVILCAAVVAQAETIHVAVASNFTAPMHRIKSEFERETGHRVQLSFGASGKFYAQIKQGAPYQIFFSADQSKPQALEDEGLTVPGWRYVYAVGTLVLWTAKTTTAEALYQQLQQGDYHKLALANPKLAPYGAAAVKVLETLQLHQISAPKWVQGENIAQTYQFVYSQNAELGFVALSQVLAPQSGASTPLGTVWSIPSDWYDPIRQDVVLLPKGANSPAAKDFLRYMRRASVLDILQSFGYSDEPLTHALPQ